MQTDGDIGGLSGSLKVSSGYMFFGFAFQTVAGLGSIRWGCVSIRSWSWGVRFSYPFSRPWPESDPEPDNQSDRRNTQAESSHPRFHAVFPS